MTAAWGVLRKRVVEPPPSGPPFATVARHIRGRVFVLTPANGRRATLYGLEVRNERTGRVLATDNCTHLGRLVDECHEATAAARGAWLFNFRRKDVK